MLQLCAMNGEGKMKKFMMLAMIAVGTAGCQGVTDIAGPSVAANVSSFSELPKKFAGKTIHLLAHPEEKNKTLEWKSYRPKFENGFRKAGFTVATIDDSADYVAFVSYGVDGGKIAKDIVSMPVYGSTGGGTTYHSGTVYGRGYGRYSGTSYSMPTFGVVGSRTSTVTSEIFGRNIAIDIVERKTRKKVYEGRLRSSGPCSQMNQVIDELVEGFFQKFPDGSGRVEVAGTFDC